MTPVQEVTQIMERMPLQNQKVVLELLRMMRYEEKRSPALIVNDAPFKRTGKSNFHLPADFDEHFDDLNDEIADLFSGVSV